MRNPSSIDLSNSCQVLLEQILHKTLGKTDSVLEATSLRLAQVEAAAAGQEQSGALVDFLREELGRVTAEKEFGYVYEMAIREMHQQEIDGLVSRYRYLIWIIIFTFVTKQVVTTTPLFLQMTLY